MRKLKKTGIGRSGGGAKRGERLRRGLGHVGEDRRDQEAVCPNRGREDLTPGSGMRQPAMLLEKRGVFRWKHSTLCSHQTTRAHVHLGLDDFAGFGGGNSHRLHLKAYSSPHLLL
ncbi:hypothetical protein NDU88_008976 [Pleurodeles waltl]|uniref:Uncharacterized protein n=1 Tax=Pleurodeles waltl TaxID=8319 RepID=A0AAV7P0V8_PLEWA|nr:hypothetical protein NDU88_008976 [Pleurodeles waltl]